MAGEEKRKYPRIEKQGIMRIYTSIAAGKYTVQTKDISKGGAFIRTKHLPKVGEIITYIIVDSKTYREMYIGNATVKWLKDSNCNEEDMGFGIELEKELTDDIFNSLVD